MNYDFLAIDLRGVPQLLAKFDRLTPAVQRSVLRGAVETGAKPLVAAIKAGAKQRRRTGQLATSIGVKVSATRSGWLTARIGPRQGFKVATVQRSRGSGRRKARRTDALGSERKSYIDPVRYAHLVEFGHGGPHPAPPHPFMRPAFESAAQHAMIMLRNALWDGIQAEVKKLGAGS